MTGRAASPGSTSRRVAAAGLTVLACAGAGQAIAASDPEPPPAAYKLPGVTLKIDPSQVTVDTRDQITFTVALTRKLTKGTIDVTLPTAWRERSPVDGAPLVGAPLTGKASSRRVRVRRDGRVVRFAFTKGRRGDTGTYTITDNGLKSGTYRPRFSLRVSGYQQAYGTASVVVLALPTEVPVP